MKNFIIWLEADNTRLRKLLAIGIFIVWVIATIASYIINDTLPVYALVTGQLVTVIGFYMSTKPKG